MLPLIRRSHQSMIGICNTGLCLLTLCALGVLVGCGGDNTKPKKMGTSTGKITLKGKPVTDCRINFSSSQTGVGAGSDLKEDGSYTLEGEVPIGKYSVFITPPQDFTPAKAQMKSGLDAVPAKYRGESTSGLTAEIKEGENEYSFDLK